MPPSRDPADETRRVELPPSETGPVPVSVAHADTRWFGIPPPLILLGLAAASFAGAIACFTGPWPFGLILLGVSGLFGAGFVEVAKRRPGTAFTRLSADVAVGVRRRAGASLELLWARTRAVAERERVHTARSVIESERRAARLRLAEAERSEDDSEAAMLRERLYQLDQAETALGEQAGPRIAQADERVRQVRFAAAKTMVVVPEPYPPPDEGDPPTPAPVPEPYPPPDEDTRRPAA
ncbi:MAG: hypothetical protein JOY72_03180 [Actinobacteria bacterium]|nr:hypothetical protein [Actinomycetota bacterium]MBV8479285.1 hypothetical protein [Actinomycetota bacterium]